MRAARSRRASAIGVLAALVVGAVSAVALVVVSGFPFAGRAPLGRAAALSAQPLLTDSLGASTSDTQTSGSIVSSALPSSSVPAATTTTVTSTPSATTPPPSKASPPPPRATTGAPTATNVEQTTANQAAASLAQQVFSRVNQARARAGCQPLSEDARLDSEAQQHSADMARLGRLSIDSYDQRARAAGYPNPGGENVAAGYRSADQVMNAWLGNDTQRRNILDCGAVAMGVGLDTNGWYWTQDFGR